MNKHASTQHEFFYRVLSKILIASAFITLFAFFLYMPLFIDLFKSDKTLNVCIFAETISPESIARFEKKTGIKVNVTYAELDDYIYAKFRINEGEGYDVVNMSDFMVNILGQQKLLHPIDHSKIKSISLLNKNLLNQAFDPGSKYSMPHKWYVYGLVYDKEFFKNYKQDTMSLQLIFNDPQELYNKGLIPKPYKLCMLDDARDSILLSAMYLFGRFESFSDDDFAQISDLLIKQKKWVEAYTIHSAQYFLFTSIVPIALTSSNHMKKILENSNRFEFAIPKEGSMLVVENLVIPQRSKRVDLAHQFIDFMLSDEIAILNSAIYEYNSSNEKANEVIDRHFLMNRHLYPSDQVFRRLRIPLLPQNLRKKIEDIWLEVGFA